LKPLVELEGKRKVAKAEANGHRDGRRMTKGVQDPIQKKMERRKKEGG
jgi:hypothetical protein